jgi:hypothetical protein
VADELVAIQEWIFDTLAGDATLTNLIGGSSTPRIYVGAAPQEAIFPLVIIRHLGPAAAFGQGGFTRSGLAGDVMAVGARRVATSALYRVAAVTNKRSFKALSPIVTLIDSLLQRGEGGDVIACVREAPFQRGSLENGVHYSEAGGDFVITATPV